MTKIASKPTTGKGQAAPATISLVKHEKVLAAYKEALALSTEASDIYRLALANVQRRLDRNEACYENLEHEVIKAERSLSGISVLLMEEDGGTLTYAEEAKVILDLALDSLTNWRTHFASVRKEVE